MKTIFLIMLITSLSFVGCKEDELLSSGAQESKISIELKGLEDLGSTHWYEAWVKYDSAAIEITKTIHVFTSDGGDIRFTVDVPLGILQKGKAVIITIEDDDVPGARFIRNAQGDIIDTVYAPSDYRILAAKIVANNGSFSLGDDFLLKHDFDNATMSFVLDTPTDGVGNNPKSGLWFINYEITEITDTTGAVIGYDTTLVAGLDLPDLPDGWTYEGWVMFNQDSVSTGKFISAEGADDGNPYSGPQAAYPFPGEDFLTNAPSGITFPTDLSGKEVLVTLVPPYPEESKPPYKTTVFKGVVPSDASPKTVYTIGSNSESFPGGSLSIQINIYE